MADCKLVVIVAKQSQIYAGTRVERRKAVYKQAASASIDGGGGWHLLSKAEYTSSSSWTDDCRNGKTARFPTRFTLFENTRSLSLFLTDTFGYCKMFPQYLPALKSDTQRSLRLKHHFQGTSHTKHTVTLP